MMNIQTKIFYWQLVIVKSIRALTVEIKEKKII
jgi:hypothetical protein